MTGADGTGDVARRPGRLAAVAGRLRHVVGLDRAVVFTVMARGWSAIAGLVMLGLITSFLSPAQQGYYYTFWSLVALQVVFELGFFTVILQLAAHEAAHLSFGADGTIAGDPVAHRRLASIAQWSTRWYAVAGLMMAGVLLPFGMVFFHTHPQPGAAVNWMAPWCGAVAAMVLKFQVDPLLSFLEGCGFVPQVARTRLVQSLVSSLLACAALATGYGLYAPALFILGQALAGAGWLLVRLGLLRALIRLDCRTDKVRWKEIWPFQWRIAVSWLSGYFIFQLFNPVMFTYWGAEAAGRIGMALNISSAISSVTIAWINTKAAVFGGLIARRQYAELDRIFFRALKQSVALCLFASLTVLSADLYLRSLQVAFVHRVLDPGPLAMFLCIPVLAQISSAQALYLRAHKQEKFMINSLVGAVCVGCSTFFLGRQYGAIGMASGYLAVSVLVGLTMGTWTFLKYRKAWHQ